MTISDVFPRYTDFDPLVPVWCVTPNIDGCVHRFFDASSISPSGRYVGVTRLRFEDRMPKPGDSADVVLVDLEAGTEQVVAKTRGWDTQLGAQVQWGADDSQLFFNDLDPQTWHPFGVRYDPETGDRKELDGTVYMVSRDGKWAASPCLRRIGRTQAGYGVLVPDVPENRGAPDDDGLFVTDTETGVCKLLVSIREMVVATGLDSEGYAGGDFYAFHVKWNPQGDRLMVVLRWIIQGEKKMGRKLNLITMKADGSDLKIAIPDAEWGKGGHHPDWAPDGETVTINIKTDGETLRFVKAHFDGTNYGVMTEEAPGSGHPSLHKNGRHMLTDVYLHESLAYGDGTTPIRWIDLETGEEQVLIRIHNDPPYSGPGNELRIDPHPAWDRAYQRIVFNGCDRGVRRVYVADLSGIV